jgi:branched-chain amino acid transport system permease protein
MDMLTFVLQLIFAGIVSGGIYALLVSAWELIIGVLRVVNFAFAAMIATAAFLNYIFLKLGINHFLSFLIATLLVFAVGLMIDSTFLRLMRKSCALKDITMNSWILTFGLGIALQNLLLFLFGADYRMTPPLISGSVSIFEVIHVSWQQFIIPFISLFMITILFILLKRTKLGLIIRSISQDPELVELKGVDTEKIYAITFGIGTLFAGIAGLLIAPIVFVSPFMAGPYTLKVFVIVCLAGFGNITGAFIASIALGVSENIILLIPALSSEHSIVLFYLIVFALILLKPFGVQKKLRLIGVKRR